MQERENDAAIEMIQCPIESIGRIEKRNSGESSEESSCKKVAHTSVSLWSILSILYRVYNIFSHTQNEIWDNTALQLTSQREKTTPVCGCGRAWTRSGEMMENRQCFVVRISIGQSERPLRFYERKEEKRRGEKDESSGVRRTRTNLYVIERSSGG